MAILLSLDNKQKGILFCLRKSREKHQNATQQNFLATVNIQMII